MKHIIISIWLSISMSLSLFAVTDSVNYPRIGERCPDFLLTEVQQFHKTEVTLDDFKGKWLILDFWSEYCASCIQAFPKMDTIQRAFAEDIQVLFIGVPRKGKDPNSIRELYEVHRKKLDLTIPIVYDDKLAYQFAAQTYPHLVVIDPDGIVRYITLGLTIENVRDMVNGHPIKVSNKYNAIEKKPYDDYDNKTPFLIAGNGGDELEYFYRSILSKATERVRPMMFSLSHDRIEMLGCPLTTLYQYAYLGSILNMYHNITDKSLYGAYWPVAVIEVKDSTLFSPNTATKENLFSYSVHIQDTFANITGQIKLDFREILKKDLDMLFPFTAQLESRMMPYYNLYLNKDKVEQLKSKYEKREIKYTKGKNQGFVGKKVNLSQIITIIVNSPDYENTIPILFDGNDIEIDLELESAYFEDIVKELRGKGIHITKEEKEMQVLVIWDK